MTLSILKSLAFTILFILLGELCASWLWLDEFYDNVWLLKRYYFICGFLQILVFMLFLALLKGSRFIDVEQTKTKYYVIATVAGVLFVYFQAPLNIVYNYFTDDSYNTVLFRDVEFGRVATFNALSTIILIPITEEFYFRKFIQGALLKRSLPGIAIFLSAVFFSIIHLSIVSTLIWGYPLHYHHAYITFFGGLITAFLYYKSESIGPSVLFHVFWNLAATML